MRVDRIVKQYRAVGDYREKEKVYTEIFNDYSVADISVTDFTVLLESEWKIKYTPEKIGKSEIKQKEENSRILRSKIAELSAGRICTDVYELKDYENLALLLDYSGTAEADERNKAYSRIFMHGSVEEKTALFWEKLKPLLELKESVLEGKTDDELAKNWEVWQPLFEQFSVLDKITEEAVSVGVKIEPKLTERMNSLWEKSASSIGMLNSRAGVVASAYYSVINEEDIQKMDEAVLRKMTNRMSMTFKDYIADNLEIIEGLNSHIENQLSEKLKQIGYKHPKEAVLGNLRGKSYEYNMAIEVLKSKRPVYVIGKERKLVCVVEATGRDGFLKPIANQKQNVLMSDYLEKARELIKKLIEEKRPLSEDGVKSARMYMAKMVCYEKLRNEKKLGYGNLYQAIGEDEQKFVKATNMIYKDPVFERLTQNIGLEQLEEFVNNRGEVELNKRYVRELMAGKQEREGIVNVKI